MRRRACGSINLVVFLLFGLLGPGIGPCVAQDAPPDNQASVFGKPFISGQGGSIPTRVIDGRIVIACDISGPLRRIPINIWLDFDGAYGLQLHNRAAAPLPAETGEGEPLPLTLHFPDFTLTVPRRELGDEEAFEEYTKYHSSEIGENALVGAIGAHYLKEFSVVLDLPRNRIELRPPGSLNGRPSSASANEVVVPITQQNDLVWLPVTLEGNRSLAMAIGTINYDSLIDRALAEAIAHPAGHVEKLACRSIDFSEYVALRPEDVILVHPDGVAGVIGINLLQAFRIEVDRQSGLAEIARTRDPEFPQQDLDFFVARSREDADAMEAWLTANPEARLNREAAELLLTLRLEEGATEEQLRTSVKWIHDTIIEDLRATRMLDLIEELFNDGEIELVLAAGEMGIESGRKDRYPDAVHKLHSRLGEVLLERNEDREAWRHLLAAAFGLPEDGMINLSLGRYYEKAGRFRRAFSRYIQAVIKEESGELAMEGLQRIDSQMPEEDRLSWEVIERMIAGKVRNFGAPITYSPEEGAEPTGRTVLVEFFTNAHLGDERRGAIGGALGYQGLLTHFEPDHCVFLSYHLAAPRPDPLVNALAVRTAEMLNISDPVVQVIDGIDQAPGAGRWRDAEGIYDMARSIVAERLAIQPGFGIEGNAQIKDGRITGDVIVEAAADLGPAKLQIVVAERGVIFPGKSTVVIHRMVARGSVLDEIDGVDCVPEGDGLYVSFDRAIADIETANRQFLSELESSGAGAVSRMSTQIDPTAVVLIVVIRDVETGEVQQARQIEPEVIDARQVHTETGGPRDN